jgi:hypothetical protein
MNTQSKQQLVITDSALMVWIAGLLLAVWGGASLFYFPSRLLIFFSIGIPIFKIMNPLIFVTGLVMILCYPNLTIIADRSTRTLRLDYRYLLFRGARVIPFDDIANIRIQTSQSTSDGHTSTSYRIVATLKDGKTVPFRTSYGSVDPRQVKRLQAYISYKTKAQLREAASQIEQSGISENPDETGGINVPDPNFEQEPQN